MQLADNLEKGVEMGSVDIVLIVFLVVVTIIGVGGFIYYAYKN